jgi:hypothetical protein
MKLFESLLGTKKSMKLIVYDLEAGKKEVFRYSKSEVVIGSGGACDIILHDPGVLAQHVRFYHQGHHRFLDVLAGATVELGYSRIDSSACEFKGTREVKAGEYCRIDEYPFKLARYVIQSG